MRHFAQLILKNFTIFFSVSNFLLAIKSSWCPRRFEALQLIGLIVDKVIILNPSYKSVMNGEFEFDNNVYFLVPIYFWMAWIRWWLPFKRRLFLIINFVWFIPHRRTAKHGKWIQDFIERQLYSNIIYIFNKE